MYAVLGVHPCRSVVQIGPRKQYLHFWPRNVGIALRLGREECDVDQPPGLTNEMASYVSGDVIFWILFFFFLVYDACGSVSATRLISTNRILRLGVA
jgi:hypothetical protein